MMEIAATTGSFTGTVTATNLGRTFTAIRNAPNETYCKSVRQRSSPSSRIGADKVCTDWYYNFHDLYRAPSPARSLTSTSSSSPCSVTSTTKQHLHHRLYYQHLRAPLTARQRSGVRPSKLTRGSIVERGGGGLEDDQHLQHRLHHHLRAFSTSATHS
jgi:hypothetical protein